MTEELNRKKSVRAAHKSFATRLMNQGDARMAAEPLDTDELTLVQTNLKAKVQILEALNTEVVELTPEDQLENEIERADGCITTSAIAIPQLRGTNRELLIGSEQNP